MAILNDDLVLSFCTLYVQKQIVLDGVSFQYWHLGSLILVINYIVRRPLSSSLYSKGEAVIVLLAMASHLDVT